MQSGEADIRLHALQLFQRWLHTGENQAVLISRRRLRRIARILKVCGQLLKAEEEHEGLRMLGLFQYAPGVLMLKNKVITSPDDYKGLRIRTSGDYIGGLMADLGKENSPMSPTAVREALTDGTIDGVAFPYAAGSEFSVNDEITFVSELAHGYYHATWFFWAYPRRRRAKMSQADFDTIRDHSANTAHVLAATAFDYADYRGVEAFKAKGIAIDTAKAEVTDHIITIARGYEQRWAPELAAKGYDGAKALALPRRITGG